MARRALGVAGFVVALAVGGCSGGEGPPEHTLTSIELSPPSATLQTGATQQFTATGHFSDGGTATVPINWTATGGNVTTSGLFTAGSVTGTYQVVATEQGGTMSKAAAVTVTAAPPVLTSISVAPSNVSLAPMAAQQFVATGHFSGGGTGTVSVTWTATGGAISPTGLYTADAVVGSYQVTATQTGGSIAGTATVTITLAPPTLTSISIAPASVTLIPSATQQFTATAHYSDNSTGTIPVDWTATSGAVSSDGLYTAGATDGSYQVTATATGGTVSGSASVTIATPPPNLVAIEISPDTLVRLKPGTTAHYTVIGRLSDGGTTPVAVDWTTTSAPPPANAPYNAITVDGLFTAGHALGSFLVVATQHSGTLADTVTVNVHETTGKSVEGPNFWTPSPGIVYLCTSNHYTDDALTNGGVATITAVPATGVLEQTITYVDSLPPVLYPDGAGEVAVVCQQVWNAPIGLAGTVSVSISVASTRPGTGMAKVFVYESVNNPQGRADYTPSKLQDFGLNGTTAVVTSSVDVSATEGANIWFKSTNVP